MATSGCFNSLLWRTFTVAAPHYSGPEWQSLLSDVCCPKTDTGARWRLVELPAVSSLHWRHEESLKAGGVDSVLYYQSPPYPAKMAAVVIASHKKHNVSWCNNSTNASLPTLLQNTQSNIKLLENSICQEILCNMQFVTYALCISHLPDLCRLIANDQCPRWTVQSYSYWSDTTCTACVNGTM